MIGIALFVLLVLLVAWGLGRLMTSCLVMRHHYRTKGGMYPTKPGQSVRCFVCGKRAVVVSHEWGVTTYRDATKEEAG